MKILNAKLMVAVNVNGKETTYAPEAAYECELLENRVALRLKGNTQWKFTTIYNLVSWDEPGFCINDTDGSGPEKEPVKTIIRRKVSKAN